MNHRVLTQEQIDTARNLKLQYGYSNKKLAEMFSVGKTTIFYNVCHPEFIRISYKSKPRPKRVLNPCSKCEIHMTSELSIFIPHNYQVGNQCIDCYMRQFGLCYKNIIEL